MTPPTLTALLSLAGVLGTAALAWLTAAQVASRKRFARYERENRALWYYTRHLIDWGYRPRGPGERPPEPPESIRHLYEFGEAS
ncbi:MAG: hypothetical protein ACTH30_05375 [Leucobacter sp.]